MDNNLNKESILSILAETTSKDCSQLIQTDIKKIKNITGYLIKKGNRIQEEFQNRLNANENFKNHYGQLIKINNEQERYISIYSLTKMLFKENEQMNDLIQELKDFGQLSYQAIMNFRQKITGEQQLVYDILGSQKISYRLTEAEFIEMFSKAPLKLSYGKIALNNNEVDINEIIKIIPNIFKLTSLGIGDPLKNLNQTKDIPQIDLKKDKLYQLLKEWNNNRRKKEYKLSEARLYELYNQVKFSLFKDSYQKEEPYPSIDDPQMQQKIRRFTYDYLQSGSQSDNIAFYQMGDTIESQLTLIENKMASGRISFITLYNGISKLNKILIEYEVNEDKNHLKQELIKLYTYKGDTPIEQVIQGEAYNYAVDKIEETINNLTN